MKSGNQIERLPEQPIVFERCIGQYVHREFPVLIARAKQAKRQKERWAA